MDANFIKPSDATVKKKTSQNTTIKALEFTGAEIKETKNIANKQTDFINMNGDIETQIQTWKTENGYKEDINYNIDNLKTINNYNSLFKNSAQNEEVKSSWKTNSGEYFCVVGRTVITTYFDYSQGLQPKVIETWSYNLYLLKLTGATNLSDAEENLTTGTETVAHSSTAGQLQESISTWYKTLRMIAIVGLLSVLVYVGIRILISSTGQDKAKYKKMLTDWVAAMCILFLLQYVMVFTMEMTQSITGIFSESNGTGLFNSDGSDKLISTVRHQMKADPNNGYENASFMEMFSWLIIYLVLVIYTCVFVWQYLKRVVMLAFLTMVAPLIALTYPLDKIKDGQAQAFTMWMREYIFNALLPVIHIIIYYMLVGSAIDFITNGGNWLYAIVAVGFIIPAEKFFRKMFGFEKATSVGQLGAATGGAMVMNAINKMTHKPPKEEKEKERKVRTTSSGGYSAGGGYSGNNATGGNNGYGNGNGSGGGNPPDPTAGTNPPLTTPLSGSGLTGGTPPTRNSNTAKPKRSIANGVTGLRKKYINRKTPKKIGKLARRGITGAAGAALLGTFGLAAGIASGDVSNVGKYTTAGLAAGGYTGMSIGDKAAKIEKENREAFREGMWGEDEYKTQELMKQIWEDDEIYEQYGGRENKDQFKEDIREFYEGGIKGEDEVTAALKMKNKNGITNTDAVTIAQLNKKISNSSYGDPTRRKKFEQDIATSLRNQGYQGDVNKEAARQIKMIGDMKGLLDK